MKKIVFVLVFLMTIQFVSAQVIISKGSSWKYLDDGSDQGTSWRETSFDDSSWKSGNGELGYGDGGEATVISYGDDPDNKYICYYFRHTFSITDPDADSELKLSLLRDDGAVVYINGTEVVRSNMPEGEITYQTTASGDIDDISSETAYDIYYISSSVLTSGDNVIAVEVHQNEGKSSDVSFDLQLDSQTNVDNSTFYVAPDGDDSNQGDLQNPWGTIGYGVSKLNAGDTLYIREGEYKETFSLENSSGSEESPIVVSGYPGERPVINGKDLVSELWYPLIDFEKCDYIIFQNLEVVNSRGRGIRALNSDHITIRDIWLHHMGDAGVEGVTCGYLTIENCRIWNTNLVNDEDGPWYEDFMWSGAVSCYGDEDKDGPASHDIVVRGNEIFQNYGEGINMEGHNDGVIIENNTVWDSWAPAIHFPNSYNILVSGNLLYQTNDPEFRREGELGSGILFLNEDTTWTKPGLIHNITVINNLIMGFSNNIDIREGEIEGTYKNILIANNTLVDAHSNSSKTESVFIFRADLEDVLFENNIILQEDNTGTTGYWEPTGKDGIIFSNNLWYPGDPEDNMKGDNDVLADPLVSRSGPTGPGSLTPDYFRIKANSPAIDKGKVIDEVTRDFSDSARIGNPDIGAFEYYVMSKVNNYNNDKFIEVFPNPVSDKLNVVIKNNKHHTYTLKLFDLTGRLIIKKSTNLIQNQAIVLDVKHLSSGIYVLCVFGDGKMQTNKKIIIK